MLVEKHAFLGLVLYLWANYEKGRCSTHKMWTRKYKRELSHSIKSMKNIVSSLSENDVMPLDDELVDLIINQNKRIVYDDEGLTMWKSHKCKLNVSKRYGSQYSEVCQLMVAILDKLEIILESSSKGYKVTIWYLLHALHNLPKVYLDPNQWSLINNNIPPISCEDALQYAKSDLAMIR